MPNIDYGLVISIAFIAWVAYAFLSRKKIVQNIRAEDFRWEQQVINGIPCSVAYIKKFEWAWVATQLNTFIIVAETNDHVFRQTIENFSTNCYKYALKNNKGWQRGFQAGVASIAILKGRDFGSDAEEFCKKLQVKKHWSAMEIPVLYNTVQKTCIKFENNPVWGTLYFPYLSKLIDTATDKFN